jgi:CelD/BcsL family acetyltransferase involved in cellulose biosynthesis
MTFIGDPSVCDYADFLVSRGAENLFYPMLLDYLDAEEWQELRLFSLPQESPTLAKLPGLARERGYSVHVEEEDVAPGVVLPGTWNDYLKNLSKKDRHELRRKMRRLESYEQGFHWYGLTDSQGVSAALDDFFVLMKKSKEDKSRFLTGPRESFFRSMVLNLSCAGLLKLFFLELGGKKVASALCFDYGSKRFLYNSGLDPDYKYYSVGLLLHALCIGDAIDDGRSYFDFLRGSEPYKYDLGGENRIIYRMVVARS